MIVSSYSTGVPAGYNYNTKTGYGSTISKAAMKSTASMPVKQTISLGAVLAALFGKKQVVAQTPVEPRHSHRFDYREEKVYDENGKLSRVLKYSYADDVLSISADYDKNTGNLKQKNWYDKSGIREQYTQMYDNDGDLRKSVYYGKNGRIKWIEDYNKSYKTPNEVSWFDNQGRLTEQVQVDQDKNGRLTTMTESSALTGKVSKKTSFLEDGTKVVEEFSIVNGDKLGEYTYDKNQKLIDFCQELDNLETQYMKKDKINPIDE